jgi:serine/threonine protein kinase
MTRRARGGTFRGVLQAAIGLEHLECRGLAGTLQREVAEWGRTMAPNDGTDPAASTLPIPLDGDGSELLGTVIDGRYRLDATLGRGGMGLVYRATHINLRKKVAVKILHPSLAASPDVRNRFEREALAVGRIDHPNCVSTYDVGRLPDGALYLAMELLEGKSLADVLEEEGQVAPGRALHILAHILRGLGHIHQAGLIHRDIKPENIYLIRQGTDEDFGKILDFGIAKPMNGELDDGVRLTQAGMAFGTPIYMAPEQALGNPMDGRADLYAAAVIAYEMLCGQPPFYSEDKLEVMSMHAGKPVPPMRARLMRGGTPVPSSLEKLIVRGLTKKPQDRYATAEVFLAAVEHALLTPDGGQTSVNFERPEETGARSLLGEDGRLDLNDSLIAPPSRLFIEDDIDEVLASTPTRPQVRAPTPNRGLPRGPALETPSVETERPTGRIATKLGVDPPLLAPGDPRGRPGIPSTPGGVGIGLPYTGPSGEPIFGLTPEQRLAQVPKRRRWKVVVTIAVLAVAATIAGILIAVLTVPGDDDRLDPDTLAGKANEALVHGSADKAIQILEAQPGAIAQDPDAQLVLGNAHAARRESDAALVAYRRALALAPEKESNKALRANLRTMAADRDSGTVARAFDLWYGATQDPEAKQALLAATQSNDIERRHAAYKLAERFKLGDDVNWVNAYSMDLDQEPTCELRKEAVEHLHARGDPKAIAALERAIARKIKGPGPMRGKPYNQCLLEDANATIGYLRGLKKP